MGDRVRWLIIIYDLNKIILKFYCLVCKIREFFLIIDRVMWVNVNYSIGKNFE